MPKGTIDKRKDHPRNQLLTVKVTGPVKAAVDQEATRLGIPRSEFLAKLLDQHFAPK